jgi:acetyl esterase/lipase
LLGHARPFAARFVPPRTSAATRTRCCSGSNAGLRLLPQQQRPRRRPRWCVARAARNLLIRASMICAAPLVTGLLLLTAAPPVERPVRLDTPRGETIEVIEQRPPGRGPFPAVVLAPGTNYAMRLPALERVARALVSEGVAVFRFDWAYWVRSGAQGHPSADRAAEVEDFATVVAHARKATCVDPARILVGGKSLGSIIAWRVLRADPAVKGALLLTPVCSPKPTGPKLPDANYPDVANEARPTAWILGEADPVCTTSVLYGYLAGAKRARVAVVRGDHGFVDDLSASALQTPETDRTLSLVAQTSTDFAVSVLGHDAIGTDAPRAYTYAVHGAPLRLYVFPPTAPAATPSPAILLFHGGGWTRGRPQGLFDTARSFAAAGLVSIPVEYRLAREGTSPVAAFDDVCEALRWAHAHARELKIDPARIAGYGVSAGATMIASAATKGCRDGAGALRPAALVTLSSGFDLARSQGFKTAGGVEADAVDRSPLGHVAELGAPAFLAHGTEDAVTPFAAAKAFCDGATAAGKRCQLQPYDGLGHLLTRNLAEQQTAVSDPSAAADALSRQIDFLVGIGFAKSPRPAPHKELHP